MERLKKTGKLFARRTAMVLVGVLMLSWLFGGCAASPSSETGSHDVGNAAYDISSMASEIVVGVIGAGVVSAVGMAVDNSTKAPESSAVNNAGDK